MIQLLDKKFEIYFEEELIQKRIKILADQINKQYVNGEIYFVSVLSGSFMFTSDLLKHISVPCQVSFVKLSSYSGLNSTGTIKELIGLTADLTNKDVIVIEDIVDSGLTMSEICDKISNFSPNSLKSISLLFKPDVFKGTVKPDFIGFSIPNDFVVGYGLDYNELGRNYSAIYKLIED